MLKRIHLAERKSVLTFDDPLMPRAGRISLGALYPRAEVHVFSGTGHSAAILRPEQYGEVIRSFLLATPG